MGYCMIRYHMAAFLLGFLLDLLLGDPYFLPHPVRLIGKLITAVEKRLRANLGGMCKKGGKSCGCEKKTLRAGKALVFIVLAATALTAIVLLSAAYLVHPCLGITMEIMMTYQCLAAKCLKAESMKVYYCLQDEDLARARQAVSMIVGRDTAHLDAEGIAKAAVETVAENTSDGEVAPMLYLALGGPVLGFIYKAINTMDSMVGYRNAEYLYFGRAAAKLDDVVNFIPARLSAWMMILSSFLLGKEFSGTHAWSIYKRDRKMHASPNSAQTESVCAGALGIRLAGDSIYFGKTVKKPYLGDALRQVQAEDIRRANRLLYLTAWLCEIMCLLMMLFLWKSCGA